MKLLTSIFVLLTAISSITTFAQQPLPFPANAKLSVALTLCSLPSAKQANETGPDQSRDNYGRRVNPTMVYASLTVKNVGKQAVTVDSLNWYDAVSYLVMTDCGNPVAPVSLGKADPADERTLLNPGRTISYQSKNLDFVTGCAWFQYDLEAGRTYRVIAVYRPARYGGPIFCSQEVTVKVL